MTKFKPRCGYLGCDPVVGQCLGFCEQLHRVDASQLTDNRTVMYAGNVPTPIEFAGDEPDEDSIDWVGYLLMAVLMVFVCMGIGYAAGRLL